MVVKQHSVLVVDDDQGLAELIALTLDTTGFKTQTALDGLDGCAHYLNCPTDWVVTDIQMPKLDGLGMIRFIRAVNPSVKVLYMSGNLDRYGTLLKHEVAHNGARVLPKPFVRLDLIKMLTESDGWESFH